MSRSVVHAERRGEVKSVDTQLTFGPSRAIDSQAAVKRVDNHWILPLIQRAIDRTMQRKEAAYLLGIDQAQLTRQLSGEGHLSALRLGSLPRDFWVGLRDELNVHFGLLDRAELIEQGEALIDRGRQLLAKAAQR